MISEADISHINLLYSQYDKMLSHILNLAQENEWDAIIAALKDKENLMNKILSFEKPRLEDIKANSELYKKRLQLIDTEKTIIEYIKLMQQDTKKELSGAIRAKKILNAYEPATANVSSTFDIQDEDEE